MNRGRVGEDRGGQGIDRCPLMVKAGIAGMGSKQFY
jgi:hypothetical protein